ncbi:TIGR00730 family Rossman fold protein [Rhodospirillum sp. A1_3_36]|uniref:LOG family protein n=1 Tax=Rhodospirillum sp. A1_3_36 TaxID=3391666 RepID=UPI0039A65D7A
MSRLRSLCVFCGSSTGADPAYEQAAITLGQSLAREGITLVFGAGNVGLMGAVATAALNEGGRVVGVIPEHLTRVETPNSNLMELHVVESMHTRKRMMFDRSDAVCILPGGLGTLDETFEFLTWRQLELHHKPVILANIQGYWDPLLTLIDRVIEEDFARATARGLFTVTNDITEVIPIARGELPMNGTHPEGPSTHLF